MNTTSFIATITEMSVDYFSARDFPPLNTNLLFYENNIVDNSLNSALLRAVHSYIKSTKRFDNT